MGSGCLYTTETFAREEEDEEGVWRVSGVIHSLQMEYVVYMSMTEALMTLIIF